MKKILISLVILIFLTGCWNYKELNDYSIVTGIAIDKAKDQYEVSVLIANTTNNKNSNNSGLSTVVYSGEGNSIYTALKNIGLMAQKELYIGHSSILVISEEVAKDGVYKITDFFLRYPTVKKDFFVIVAKNSKAKDILKITTPLSEIPSQSIYENIKSTSELQGMTYKLNFNDMLKYLLKKGDELVINSIEIKGDKLNSDEETNLNSTEPNATLKIGTLGIFKDGKLIDWTTENESRGINIINGKTKEMFVDINYNNDIIVLRTELVNTKVKVKLKNNIPKATINIKSDFSIMEANTKIDLNDMKTINKIKKLTVKKMEDIIKEGINVAQENESDIFGIGQKIYKKYPKYFIENESDWNNIFKNINFDINADINVTNKGTAKENVYE